MAEYMFSKSAQLLCAVEDKGYWVINGLWRLSKPRQAEIMDWIKVDPTTWSIARQQEWYFLR